jgi:hypothetical protein
VSHHLFQGQEVAIRLGSPRSEGVAKVMKTKIFQAGAVASGVKEVLERRE